MRLRNDKSAGDKLNNSIYFLNKFPVKINKNCIIEIGAGKGEMISQLALKNQDITFYALEKYQTVAAKIIKKIDELSLKNLFVICEDANKLSEIFEGKVNELWLTFSDPWPKKRHEKRRLTHKDFLTEYAKILNENGTLKVKTDNDEFFNFSVESLNENNWKINALTNDLHNSKYNEKNEKTGYELKWSQVGKNINYLEAKKPTTN
ncbi:tRNA (guanosine(46)-N7)-methyltransferase TrmB [Mycoplasma crocodyli]|uniref:tRNA (guanine-N(7)-)-methyltransferase n=1 Tax=Mycoplasma crocodyli (strain ATCC 51981 / MP145) TaxID=512564 RepID=D5E4S3_MYCCM|nr:tRNA (guanosine(46)-N7)-methyltransferase TrmB [Mycoplasma crocodyli]ADE19606.1 tRNA (guanine-N(7)-)-methyltransferase [Mycoplasma crocodyli MP145]